MRVLVAFFTLLLQLPSPGPAWAASKPPAIGDVRGSIQGNEARVLFTIHNAFPPEMVEALKSGIEITFKATVKVERVHRNWFNQSVGEALYVRSVRFDALSRVYRLHRSDGDEILPDVRSALDRMTRFEVGVPVRGEVARGKPYQALVRARLDRVGLTEPLRSIVFFSSLWDVETDWARGAVTAP